MGNGAFRRLLTLLSIGALLGTAAAPASASASTCTAGTTCQVANESDLAAAIQVIDAQAATTPPVTTIQFTQSITLTTDLPIIYKPVVVDGQGYALDGASHFRGLFFGVASFLQGGTSGGLPITVENLSINNAVAQGGNGAAGGGGGAGFGGAIFVGTGVQLTLTGVSFSNDQAIGGNGGAASTSAGLGGGGGGMGGDGGAAGAGGGGGGGLGRGATGGGSAAAGAGIAYGLASGGTGATGATSGGSAGGGGGAGNGGAINQDEAGGGGIGGTAGAWTQLTGTGGFGGGGGFSDSGTGSANGGFGGGGGGSCTNYSESGGFGGGNGGNYQPFMNTPGAGGFGGGGGGGDGCSGGVSLALGGGGGAGMGGAIFVQEGGSVDFSGTFNESGAGVLGGVGGADAGGATTGGAGSAFGKAMFLQGNGGSLTFTPAAGQTETLGDGITDQAAVSNAATVGWSLLMNGAGTLTLAGDSSYDGGTTVDSGTLQVSGTLHSDVTVNGGLLEVPVGGTVTGNVTVASGATFCDFGTVGGTHPANSPGCYPPPSATISSPASGSTYTPNQVVSTSFSCADGAGAPGLVSCVDSNGVNASGGTGTGTLDTATAGTHTYTVTATSTDGLTTSTHITYTVSLPCSYSVTFQLTQVTTSGGVCLYQNTDGTYQSAGPIEVNGLKLPSLGGSADYLITPPSSAHPGGQFGLIAFGGTPNVQLSLGDNLTIGLGDISWSLPAAPSSGNQLGTVATLSLPSGTKLEGLELGGSVSMEFGKDSNGTYYATFPLTVDLPSIFKNGPGKDATGLTGTAAVRVDNQGTHFDGIHIEVSGAYIGSLEVKSACFAYLPGGSSGAVNSCPEPALPGSPLPSLTCAASGGSSWSGSADIVLPLASKPELSFYGSVVNGSLSGLSVAADHLGIPIAEDVTLESVGIQLCVPSANQGFQIAGSVGIGAIKDGAGNLVDVTGSFSYTDAWQGNPWSASIGGSVSVLGEQVGSGTLTFGGNNVVSFNLSAGVNLSIVSINGQLQGFFETASPYQFSVNGSLSVCLQDIGCLTGEGAVSSIGVSGCATVSTIHYWVAVKNSNWKWYAPWRVHWVEETSSWQAGFGYSWGGGVSVWGSSCDIGNYELATPAAHPRGFLVTQANYPVAVRIDGAGGAPRVRIRTPAGRIIQPPAGLRVGERIRGVGMLLENRTLHETSLLLTTPQKGAWRVEAVRGSAPITAIRTARTLPPPVLSGAVHPLKSGKVAVALAYSLAPGEHITLYATGPHHLVQLIGRVKGRPCPQSSGRGPAQRLCRIETFTPSYGPSGRRVVSAIVENSTGLSVTRIRVGAARISFAKPKPTTPALRRKGRTTVITWAAVPHADHYVVGVNLGDGRKLSITTAHPYAAVARVTLNDSVRATVWPVMADGSIGRSASARLRAGVRATKPKHPKHHKRKK